MNAEALTRVGAFIVVLGAMAVWEWCAPRRPASEPRASRWLSNLGLVAIDTLFVRLIFPVTAVALAALAEARGWGMLRLFSLPGWLAVAVSVVLLDFIIYWQHVLFHAVPALWRLHLVHHSDRDFDTSTGVRFHPLEIALSMGIKMVAIVALGVAPLAVLIFEIVLNATSLFSHANVTLAPPWDRLLRLVVVTPDMHRVHHSILPRETNSNFGFNLPWWDRLFGTYRPQPQAGHQAMRIGLQQLGLTRLTLGRLLALPFSAPVGDYPINRRARQRGE